MLSDLRSQDSLPGRPIFSGIMFPSKGMKLEKGTKVSKVSTDEDILRSICNRPPTSQTLQPIIGQEIHVMKTDFPLSTL